VLHQPTNRQQLILQSEPTTFETTNNFCDRIIKYKNKYNNVASFRAGKDGQGYLDSTIANFFVAHRTCGSNDDAKILDYVYDFKYRKKKQRLVVKLFVCCDAGAEFDDSYVVPKGYAPRKNGNGSGRRLLTENGTVSTMNGMNYIFIGFLVLICCIVGVLFWKRYIGKKDNKSETNVSSLHEMSDGFIDESIKYNL